MKRPNYPSDVIILKRELTVWWSADTFCQLRVDN